MVSDHNVTEAIKMGSCGCWLIEEVYDVSLKLRNVDEKQVQEVLYFSLMM